MRANRIPLALPLLLAATFCHADLKVHTDFPGGAAEVVRIDGAQITFKIPVQKSGGWQAWWFMKVSGIEPGQTLSLHVLNGSAAAGRAVWSTDQKTWQFTQPVPEKDKKKTAVYQQKIDAVEAWFAWYVPYLPAHVEALARDAAKRPFVKVFDLCRSEEDRPVIALRIAEGDSQPPHPPRPGIWIHARQHAWEVGSSWTAEGLGRWLISDDPRARSLRQNAEIILVPIVDIDSVAGGRGGKDQRPHDHNRDWVEKPRWNAIAAAMQMLKQWDREGKLDLFLDLHDPGWNGKLEFWCHTYPRHSPPRKHNTDLFLHACKTEMTGPLAFDGRPIARYALSTPTSGIWASSRTREKVVGGTFEIGVAPPRGVEKPVEYHLTCGQQLGLGIERFIANRQRKSE